MAARCMTENSDSNKAKNRLENQWILGIFVEQGKPAILAIIETRFNTFPLHNQCASAWSIAKPHCVCYHVFAHFWKRSMLLWMWEDEFLNFLHHQEQSPDLTSGYILKLISNRTFSIDRAVIWNLGLFSLRHFGHFSKITKNFRSFFHFGTFLYDWKWHYDQIDSSFFGHFRTTSVCDRKIPKKQVGTQSREMFLSFRQSCPWEYHSYGNPMGNVPWDGMGPA